MASAMSCRPCRTPLSKRGGPRLPLPWPRGTGKTTSARVLAKALNCENLSSDGEPCGECESCIAIEQGRSFDLHELDAASNNKVEDMRDLLAKVNLGTPGRAKVYILDEVHMLTSRRRTLCSRRSRSHPTMSPGCSPPPSPTRSSRRSAAAARSSS